MFLSVWYTTIGINSNDQIFNVCIMTMIHNIAYIVVRAILSCYNQRLLHSFNDQNKAYKCGFHYALILLQLYPLHSMKKQIINVPTNDLVSNIILNCFSCRNCATISISHWPPTLNTCQIANTIINFRCIIIATVIILFVHAATVRYNNKSYLLYSLTINQTNICFQPAMQTKLRLIPFNIESCV